MANPIKSLIGQTAIYGLSSIIGRFINYLLVPFYSYIFITNEYGVVAELTAYVTILVVLLTYGMETAFFRFSQNENYTKNSIYSTAITSLISSSIIFAIFLLLFGHHIAKVIGYQSNPEFVILLGLTVTIDAFTSIPFARLRIQNKARRFAIIKLINIFINVFFNILFLFLIPRYAGTQNFIYSLLYPNIHVGYIFISYFLTSIITLLLLFPELKEGFKNYSFRIDILKKMLKYGFPVLLAGLAGMFSESLDRILLKYLIVVPDMVLKDPNFTESNNYIMSQLGIYGANVKVAVIMTLFLQAFRYAAEPFFFNYSKQNDSRLIYAKVMKYFIAFSLFVFLGVTLFIDLVKFMIGPSYRIGLSVVPMLLMSKIFFGIVFNLSIWYKLKNLTKYGAYIAIIGAICSVSLNFVLIPVFGYVGAAWASVISYFIMMIVSFILEKRNFNIPYDYLAIFIYFATAILFYFINVYMRLFTEYYIILNFLMIFAFVFIFLRKEKINLSVLYRSLVNK